MRGERVTGDEASWLVSQIGVEGGLTNSQLGGEERGRPMFSHEKG